MTMTSQPSAHQTLTDVRTGLDPATIAQAFRDNLACVQARFPAVATRNDYYMALAYTVRDRLLQRRIRTAHAYFQQRSRIGCYLSAEFLMGPQLGNNLVNLGIYREAAAGDDARGPRPRGAARAGGGARAGQRRPGPAGRLLPGFAGHAAACPAIGYGIRYEFGIFDQEIRDGWQVEITDKWLRLGNPWEICAAGDRLRREVRRPHRALHRRTGRLAGPLDPATRSCGAWPTTRRWSATAPDTVNLLRLWKAEAVESFDFQAFNTGDYYGAVLREDDLREHHQGALPQRRVAAGQEAAPAAAVLLRLLLAAGHDPRSTCSGPRRSTSFADKFAVQLNDTHPSIAVAELMRLLVDEHGLDWDAAWEITRQIFGYTNHTLLPEALETMAACRSSQRCCRATWRSSTRSTGASWTRCAADFPGDEDRVRRLSLIDESRRALRPHGAPGLRGQPRHQRRGRAAHRAAARPGVLRDFYEIVAGEVQQQDQRRHAAPLPAC